MKIKYNSIKVKDIAQALKFYNQILNLEIIDEYYSDTISVVMLTDGYMNLELIEDSSEDYGLDNIGFVVNDIDDISNQLAKNDVEYDEKVYENNHILSLKDYDGVKINIMKND